MNQWHVTIEVPPALRERNIGVQIQEDLNAKKSGLVLAVEEVQNIPGGIQWKAGRVVRSLAQRKELETLRAYVVIQTMKLLAGPDTFLCPIVFLAAANTSGPYAYWTFPNFSELDRRKRGLANTYEQDLKRIGEKFFKIALGTEDEILAFSHIAGSVHAVVVEKQGWLKLGLQHLWGNSNLL